MSETSSPGGKPSAAPNVAKAGLIMMVSLLLSRVLGIVRDSVIGGMFGLNAQTDAYRLAFQIPDLLFFLIAGGALSSAFIPVFSEYLHTDREDDAWEVFSVVASVMSIVIVAFIVVASVFALPLAKLVAPGPEREAVLPLIAHMSRILLPAQFAFFIGGLMFGTLYARQVFSVPGLGPNVYNLGIIFGAVALSSLFTPGVIGMTWGALGGAVIGNLVIPFLAMRKLNSKFRFSLNTRHPGVRKVFKMMLPVVLGLSLPGVNAMIAQGFGSFYAAGVNASLDFANKLMQAPLGIFGQSLAIAVFPALSQFFAQGQMPAFRSALTGTLRQVVFLTIPVTVLMIVMARPIVGAIYQHGAFTPQAADQTAILLQWYAIGIAGWCLHPVLMRAYFSLQNTVTPIVQGTATTGVFVVMILVLQQTALGLYALPLASSLAAWFLVGVMAFALSRRLEGLDIASVGTTAVKSLAASVPLAVLGALCAYGPLAERIVNHKLPTLLAVGAVLVVGGGLYAVVARKLGMKETEYLDRALKRLDRKRGATP